MAVGGAVHAGGGARHAAAVRPAVEESTVEEGWQRALLEPQLRQLRQLRQVDAEMKPDGPHAAASAAAAAAAAGALC